MQAHAVVEEKAPRRWLRLRSPRRLALLLGGNVVVAVLLGLSLSACLVAFGAYASAWSVIALDVGISRIAALFPSPVAGPPSRPWACPRGWSLSRAPECGGWGGAGEPGPSTYLPAVSGWFATQDLVKRDWL